MHREVGLILHLGEDILVEVQAFAVKGLRFLFEKCAEVVKTLLIAFFVLPIRWTVFLDRVIRQVHIIVFKVVIRVISAAESKVALPTKHRRMNS